MLKELREDMEKRRQQCVKKKKKEISLDGKLKKTKRNSAAEKYNN